MVLGKSGSDILIQVFVDYIKSEEFIGGLQQDVGSGSYLKAAMGSLTASLVNAISDSVILGSVAKTLKEVFQSEILEELQPYVKEAICNMPPLSELIGDLIGVDFGGESSDQNARMLNVPPQGREAAASASKLNRSLSQASGPITRVSSAFS
jgi:hypothetical protein